MDFFAQQDEARRNTRLLVIMFLVAVVVLVLLTNLAVGIFMYFIGLTPAQLSVTGQAIGPDWAALFTWQRLGYISVGVGTTVALVVLVKWLQLATGGKAVAEGMGAVRILPQTQDRDERRCLNVVEEMALAANMPVPPVYVLNDERGINAFAAGITPADAVVAVTRGTLGHLKRHELQGVIAHEFSHILNGDMRLNIRLAALLKGITFIGDVGYFLLRHTGRVRTGSRGSSGDGIPALPMLGLGLSVLGWVGAAIAGFIKAAISRQKEYLADASAVQYTRSPDGIGDALKVIGGYIPGTLVHAARAIEMSHIFFGEIEHRLWQVFATHPPLDKRIRRVDPSWNGKFIERKPKHYARTPTKQGDGEVGVGRAAIVAAAAATAAVVGEDGAAPDAEFGDSLDNDTAEREAIPLAFVRHSHEPLGAHALVYSLVLAGAPELRERQMKILADSGIQGLPELVHTIAPGVAELGAPRRLPLLEMCLPALKAISPMQYRVFKDTLLALIQADRRTDLYEWCLFQLVRHYLDPEFTQVKPSRSRYRTLDKVAYHLRVVLSVLALEGDSEPESLFRDAADTLGFNEMVILPREQASVAAFSRSVSELANCYPLLKPRILKAMILAASRDGELCPVEREIVASMAAAMDCPVPSLDALIEQA
ncbi:MAG: M48 family metallopeptidase [Halioglobus sp.]|nr:M48 family metallopeptidase [Halioglobus sp.]